MSAVEIMRPIRAGCLFFLFFVQCPVIAVADDLVFEAGEVRVTRAELEHMLAGMPRDERREVIGDPSRARALLNELYRQTMIERQVRAAGLDDDPGVQWRIRQARLSILQQALLAHEVARQELPDFDQLAREHYQANRSVFIRPERIRIAQIFIEKRADEADASQRLADELHRQLQAGEAFDALARSASEGPFASSGGEFPDWITRQMVADNPLLEAVFALEDVGAFTGVLESEGGYHILRLLERQEQRLSPYEEVRGRIIDNLSRRYVSGLEQQVMQSLNPPQDATLNTQVLEAVLEEVADTASETSSSTEAQ